MRTTAFLLAAVLLSGVAGCGDKGKPDPVHGGKRVSAWVKDLKSDDVAVRRTALTALAEMPPRDAADSIPTLMALSQDPDKLVRCRAALAMAHITSEIRIPLPVASLTTPEMTKMLKDDDPVIRRTAAKALGRFGPAASKNLAVPALQEALKDADEETRQAAEEALQLIGPMGASDEAGQGERAREPGGPFGPPPKGPPAADKKDDQPASDKKDDKPAPDK